MLSLHAITVLMVLIAPAQAGKLPDAWERKIEAALSAEHSGHLAQAEALVTEVIEEAEKLGQGDLRLAEPLELLATFLSDKKRNRVGEAEVLFRRALAIREATQGPEHSDVANTLVGLATCRIAAEKRDDATGLMLRRASKIVEKTKGQDDPGIAKILHAQVFLYMHKHEYDAAGLALSRALAIREKAFGPASTKVAELLDDQGDLHAFQIDVSYSQVLPNLLLGFETANSDSDTNAKKAQVLYERALAIREKALKPDHPDIAESLYNLGQLAVICRRWDDVERYLERWLALYDKANLPATEKLGKILVFLADAAIEHKDFNRADQRLSRAQTVFEKVDGTESEMVSSTRTDRATVAIEAGHFDTAEALLKQGLSFQAALIGEDNPDVKQAKALMAGHYQDHAGDRLGYVLWSKLNSLATEAGDEHKHDQLAAILRTYTVLLRRTSRVVPVPTEDDLAYLRKVGAVHPETSLETQMRGLPVVEKILDDQGLSHIARFFWLERLDLNSSVTDAGLAQLKGLTLVRELKLTSSQITDAGLIHLAGLKSLEKLDLGFTRIGDAGLLALKGLKKLRELDLSGTNVTDAGLNHLKGLENLSLLKLASTNWLLELGSTKVTEAGVDRLRREKPTLVIQYESGNGFVLPTRPADSARIAPAVPARP